MRHEVGHGVNSPYGIGVIIMGGVYTLFGSLMVILLFIRRKNPIIATRHPLVLLASFIFGVIVININVASFIIGKTTAMCEILSVSYILFLPLWALPYLLILPQVVFIDALNKLKTSREQGTKEDWKWGIRWLFTSKTKLITCAIATIEIVVVYLIVKYITHIPGGEEGDGVMENCFRSSLIVVSAHIIVYFSVLGYFTMKIIFVNDPYFLRIELICATITLTPLMLLTVIFPIGPQIFPADFDFRWVPISAILGGFCFSILLLNIISTERVQEWIMKAKLAFIRLREGDDDEGTDMSNLNVLTQNLDVFRAVLEDPVLLECFTEFCVKNWSVENVLFYKEVEDFQKKYPDWIDSQITDRVQFIIHEFIEFGSPLEINIEFPTRMEIIESLNESKISAKIFSIAQGHIFELMKKDSFEKWQRLPDYKKAIEKAIRARKSSTSQLKSYTSMADQKQGTRPVSQMSIDTGTESESQIQISVVEEEN